MIKLTYFSDAGHGWVAVPRALLTELGLAALISVFSYQSRDGVTIYLEEDCDLTIFIRTLEARNIAYSIVEHVDHGDHSYIRNLERYTV
jgi:hypothetical protein